MNKEELTEKAQELTIKNVTNGKSKYYSWGFHNGCVAGLEYNNNRIADLEKENAELKKSCDETQELLDKQIEATFKLDKENAELKDKLKNLASVAEVRLANWQKYEKENVELKESITKFSKNGLDFLHSMKSNRNCIDCESKMSIQLTKAKEIIKKFSEFANNEIEYDPEHPQEHTDLWNKLCAEAEQFLSEVEK